MLKLKASKSRGDIVNVLPAQDWCQTRVGCSYMVQSTSLFNRSQQVCSKRLCLHNRRKFDLFKTCV
jgi:hypothetical protein